MATTAARLVTGMTDADASEAVDAVDAGEAVDAVDAGEAVDAVDVGADVAASDYEAAFWPLFLAAFRAAHRILGDRHAAEDAAADALTAAHLNWRRIATLPYRDAWVVRVATNRALDIARRGPEPLGEAQAQAVRFEDGMANRMSLVAALRALPRRQREVVVLRMLVGLSLDDVASVLGIGTASVRTHLGRGMKALRTRLRTGEET